MKKNISFIIGILCLTFSGIYAQNDLDAWRKQANREFDDFKKKNDREFLDFRAGDYLIIDGKKFIVCDPAYIGASIGRAMNEYKNMSAKVTTIW